ncbi:MAG: ATP-dependent endonuclease [Thaumarchaeota archaeon]|nr:ATP-dependent endonuclease [Nitrososphaerota archaeon]
MRLESVHICNFRSLRDVTVTFDDLTVFIGANSSGKTSVLEALRMFGDEPIEICREDFFSEEDPIEITLTLNPGKGHGIPAEFLHDGRVVAQKVFEIPVNGSPTEDTLIEKMCSRDFLDVRNIPKVKDRQAKIKELAKTHEGFPAPRDMWPDALDAYERERMSDPHHAAEYGWHFIPFEQCSVTLSELLPVVYVPAMRDIPADASDGGNSVLDQLLDTAVRGSRERKDEMQGILDEADQKIRQSLAGLSMDSELLSRRLSDRLKPYVDNASFSIEFVPTELKNSKPKARLILHENGLPTSMGRAGSGLQRIGLMALLETLHDLREEDGKDDGGAQDDRDTRLLLIDEPELYQHPQRQHRMLRALDHLTRNSPIQAACSTHSPYFVRLGEMERLRRFRREGGETTVSSKTLDDVARAINGTGLHRRKFDASSFAAWLDMVSSHWVVEGLFARLAVFVEGQGDRNMLIATAEAMGESLAEHEASVIPCGNKCNMPHLAQIFSLLDVPIYLVWDLDVGNKSKYNSRLNSFLLELACPQALKDRGILEFDYAHTHSYLRSNLSDATIGKLEDPDLLLTDRMKYYGVDLGKKDAKKNAAHNRRIMRDVLESMSGDAQRFNAMPTVQIVSKIIERCGMLEKHVQSRHRDLCAATKSSH